MIELIGKQVETKLETKLFQSTFYKSSCKLTRFYFKNNQTNGGKLTINEIDPIVRFIDVQMIINAFDHTLNTF